ncbi:MAG: hypothetical protein II340_05290, partial [Succinivibrio sp.]|nr:hypothetical protein [Succinivibrio sp.]
MIKLTRGALTMLLAQYRGILKNAWIKNFAVVAVLATTVTAANADPVEVETWQDAVAQGAPALDGVNGVLDIQKSGEIKGDQQITITGGTGHKIGASDQGEDILIVSKNENSYANLSINGTDSEAKLTIDNNKTQNSVKTTGIWELNKVQVGVEGEKTATLEVNTTPAWITKNEEFVEDVPDFTEVDFLEIGAKGVVTNSGELDVDDKLTIADGGSLTNTGYIWAGRDSDTPGSLGTEIEVNGTLTSEGTIFFNSKQLTVGERGSVNVKGTLGLDDLDSVNVNTLTTGEDAKITLTDKTDVLANTLVLDAANTNVKSVTAANLTLGSTEYDNSGLGADATVTTKLEAYAKDATYQIKNGETITLDAGDKNIAIVIDNESKKGSVESNLDVAGTLKVQAGDWTAKNITVGDDTNAGTLTVGGKSLTADGLTVTNGTATVESNAALALKTLQVD